MIHTYNALYTKEKNNHIATTSPYLNLNCSHIDYTSNTVPSLHGFKPAVDLAQRLPVRDELIHLQLAGQVIVDEIRQLGAAFDAAEGATAPDAAGDELEGYKV